MAAAVASPAASPVSSKKPPQSSPTRSFLASPFNTKTRGEYIFSANAVPMSCPTRLFGDEIKLSPAAFASPGLVKKRGTRSSLPLSVSESGRSPLAKPRCCPRLASNDDDLSLSGLGFHSESPSPLSSVRNNMTLKRPSVQNHGHMRQSSVSGEYSVSRRPGLRRKGSTTLDLLTDGIDSDSTDLPLSPKTPTKPKQISYFGVTTPSPTTHKTHYPFAPTGLSYSPNSPRFFPASPMKPAAQARHLSLRGPIPRSSNPMLATAYLEQGNILSPKLPDPNALEQSIFGTPPKPVTGRFDRNYTVVQDLGCGQFSRVWKVRHKVEGSTWAIKTCLPYRGQKSRVRQLEEVSILRKLSLRPNPHIIRFVDSWEQQGKLYIRTELAECGDLARFLAALGDQGGLDEGRIWKMLAELAAALEYIHNNNIIHLDLKPSNVLITRDGLLKIADFGLSVIRPEADLSLSGACRGGLSPAPPSKGPDGGFVWEREGVIASPIVDREHEGDREYLCPEALEDVVPGTEGDVFSLGILALEAALNVSLPSNGDSWVRLRNDDFSDIAEHYVERENYIAPVDPSFSVVSSTLIKTIKHLMTSDPIRRMTLEQLGDVGAMRRTRRAMAASQQGAAVDEASIWVASPALVEERNGFVEYVLEE